MHLSQEQTAHSLADKNIVEPLLQNFLRYVSIKTQSCQTNADSGIIPSTPEQHSFALLLADELSQAGIDNVTVTDHSYVYAYIPASPGLEHLPAVGFLSHMDTVPDVPADNIQPSVITDYNGRTITLADSIILDPFSDEDLRNSLGDTIITSDGTTLLGADDKAGIAVIMTVVSSLLHTIRHGPIEIIFSPDEETGHGMDFVPLELMQSKQCYTFDGSHIGEIEGECFNAWKCTVTFTGKAKHTGTARPDMINAVTMASQFISMLPRHESPETTDGYMGFYAPMDISGTMEKASATVFLRDFSSDGMVRRLQTIEILAQAVQAAFTGSSVTVDKKMQYLNMKEKLDQRSEVLDNLVKAVRRTGIEPVFKPIRGGTDGSRLTEMGIPTPNIFTGGHNFHSRSEWASLSHMIYAAQTMIELVKVWSGQ